MGTATLLPDLAVYFFILIFLNIFFTNVSSQWDFFNGNSCLLSTGKASCDRVTLLNLWCMLVHASVSIIHRTLTRTTESFKCEQMLMQAIARLGGRTHARESALKADSGRKIPCRTGESNLRQRRDGPMLHQLSYLPIPESVDRASFASPEDTRIPTCFTHFHDLP